MWIEFEKLGTHWSRGNCDYPEPDSEFQEVLTGIYMGDGNLAAHHSNNPYMRWNNVNKTFLEYLDSELGWLTTGVRLKNCRPIRSTTTQNGMKMAGLLIQKIITLFTEHELETSYFRRYKQWTSTDRNDIQSLWNLLQQLRNSGTSVMVRSIGCGITLRDLCSPVGMNKTGPSSFRTCSLIGIRSKTE